MMSGGHIVDVCVCVCVEGGSEGGGSNHKNNTSNSVGNEDLGMIEPPSEPLRYWSIL